MQGSSSIYFVPGYYVFYEINWLKCSELSDIIGNGYKRF